MRHLVVVLVSLIAMSLAACGSCSKEEGQAAEEVKEEPKAPEPEPEPPPTEQRLTFSTQGGEDLDGKTFDQQVADAVGYWLFDPKGGNTMIAARAAEHGLDTYFYAAIPQDGAGTYQFKAGPKGADTRVQIRFREVEGGKTFALLAVEGNLELEKVLGDYLIGSFSGKFVRSERLGADLGDIPEDQRQYVTISNGKFQVTWKDRLGGKATRWGATAQADAPAPTPATP
jgi:hypothetical protein